MIPTVAAVIPNYNHGDKIGVAVASLMAQTVQPDEIIIVDDASTDGSEAVIADLSKKYDIIRVVKHVSNSGAIEAINTGIHNVRSSHVYFLAADDRARPKLVEELRSALIAHPEACFASAEVELHNEHGSVIGFRPPSRPSNRPTYFSASEASKLFRKMDNFILTGASLLSLPAVRQAGCLRPALGAFADGFLVRQLAFRHGFVYVPTILAEWHINNNGLSRSAALNATVTTAQMLAAERVFSADETLPGWYWPLLKSRWEFAALRLALQNPEVGSSVLNSFAPGPNFATAIFLRFARTGAIGRTLCLVWAALYYRPTSLYGIAKTRASRFFYG